jgi:membrane fusion protein (multidrug efflux system)
MNRIFLIAVAVFIGTSCTTDKAEQLRELKSEREKITAQISQVERELAQEGKLDEHVNKTYVKTKQINAGNFKHYVEVKGTVESNNNVFVPAEMSGIVTRVLVKEGQQVTKGTLLAQLDDELIVRQIDALKTQLELATTVFERQKRLWEKEIGSEIQFLQAKTNKESAERQLDVLKKQLEMTKIISPLSGMVDQITLKEGEMAAAVQSGIRVVGLGDMKIKAKLSESYLGQISTGDTAQVAIESIDADFFQPVFAVEQVIDMGSRTFGIDIRPPHGLKLTPNTLAVVTINDYNKTHAMVVPVNVVQTDNEGSFLFVVDNQKGESVAVRRNVKPGKKYKGEVEILDGLKAGESIIIEGYQNVSNNQVVTLM